MYFLKYVLISPAFDTDILSHPIFLESRKIFGHLAPIDLLQLARVSKAFRQVLMAKSSAWLWRATWNNIPGTPSAPEDMTEPAWTQLLFGGAICYVLKIPVIPMLYADDICAIELRWQDEQ